MKTFLLKHWVKLIFTLVGALSGILYWKFVGCASGTCPITSHWYTMGGYGIIMGYLVGDIFKASVKQQQVSAKDQD